MSQDPAPKHLPHFISSTNTSTDIEHLTQATIQSRSKRWASIKRIKLFQHDKGALSHLLPKPTIVRRRNPVTAKVGVLVVVENSIYRQYLRDNGNNARVALARIRRYYGMVFAMIDQRFSTINDPNLRISVRISGILVAERREDSGWLENIVDWGTLRTHGMASVYTDRALRKFTKWVSTRKNLPEFDHAMVFTAYRLTIKQGITLGGMAYLNAICDIKSGNAVSIVADRGDFQCVKVATHELAHSLGANHDGDKHSKSCRPDANYIMSPQPAHHKQVLKNAFYFSPCSIRDMTYHLSKPTSACVKNEPPVYYSYDLRRLPPGRVYSADMQCKLIFGKKSGFCMEGNWVDVMCGQLWCRDPNKESGCRTNSYLTALPGTECGVNKICYLGECVLDSSKNTIIAEARSINVVPNIPDLVGPSFRMRGPRPRDQRRTRHIAEEDECKEDKNVRYCVGLMKINPDACGRRAVRQYCCATCRHR
ncbi:A disintegrin and metalloproteinase with thrombospondin motifs like [Physella acuta]|uniref:A disintegrin and metalloproteinase with thrombospondin motifs like n=1 Tax=Physella acuta TaxID=109671 RepID=UPI0027DD9A67|nr:A disintegrin and metalloproteinase with thrombospondin motifs like [Physella acuta]